MLVGAVAAAMALTLSGCSPPAGIGVRKDGETLTVVVGWQCHASGYLNWLQVRDYDWDKHKPIGDPLWIIAADKPAAPVPSVTIGTVPAGFREEVNRLAEHPIGRTLEVTFDVGQRTGVLFDTGQLRDGKVLNSERKLVTEKAFRSEFGC